MFSFRFNDMTITLEKPASNPSARANFPVRFGRYNEIRTPRYEYHFNLRGQIKFIRGLGADWRYHVELLKRTDGNDWVFYSVRSVGARIADWLGQYYLPCPAYATNALYEYNPFTDPGVNRALGDWAQLYADIFQADRSSLPEPVAAFFDAVSRNDETSMYRGARRLDEIIGVRYSVLPPEARLVDYEVVPLTVADGCRYHCGFCCVKTPTAFKPRPLEDIRRQIGELREFYGPDLGNYRGLFLGNHDALGAGEDVLLGAAEAAAGDLPLERPVLFMFGSADSLLEAGDGLFEGLGRLAEHTYINLGLESVHAPTLAQIKKPLDEAKVRRAFEKMLDINQRFENIELSANFLLGEDLDPEHYQSLGALLAGVPGPAARKGAVYISPLLESRRRPDLLQAFFEVQGRSKLPAWVYLIQRL